MPYPHSGEGKAEYIKRFMGAAESKKDYPDPKQRVAVAYSLYEKRNSGDMAYGATHPWPRKFSCSFIEPGVVAYSDLGPCERCGTAMSCGSGVDGASLCQPTGETVLVRQEALERMAQSFVGKPVIDVEHKDVSPSTVADGDADGIVTRVWLDDKSGWWMAEFLVWNPQAQKHCEDPNYSVSCAYEPTDVSEEPDAEYHNIPYASEILDGTYTHLALVTSPRYEAARIFVNSKKGGKGMGWKSWLKGERKNASPIDLKHEVDVDGKKVPLENLYAALEEPKDKYNDDSIFETPRGDKSLAELKHAYRNKLKKNEVAAQPVLDPTAGAGGAEAGHKEHAEGKVNAEPKEDMKCEHCNGTGKKNANNKPIVEPPLPDLRDPKNAAPDADKKPVVDEPKVANDAAEEAAKALDDAAKEKSALELQQAEDAEKLEKRNAGRKAFLALQNARDNGDGVVANIAPVGLDERLARGKAKYGKSA